MTTNYSLYSIPMYWLLAFLPRFYALNILSSANVKLHNVSPRSAEAHAKYKRGLSPRAFAAFERAEAAHANAFESAAFWVGAVVVGNWVGIGAWTMNYYSATYLTLRMAHLIAYLKIDSPNMAGIRSFFWGAATVHPLMLLIQAANKLAAKTAG